jgi:hypothetical protein
MDAGAAALIIGSRGRRTWAYGFDVLKLTADHSRKLRGAASF